MCLMCWASNLAVCTTKDLSRHTIILNAQEKYNYFKPLNTTVAVLGSFGVAVLGIGVGTGRGANNTTILLFCVCTGAPGPGRNKSK